MEIGVKGAEDFARVADILINKTIISVADKVYRIVELEFYLYGDSESPQGAGVGLFFFFTYRLRKRMYLDLGSGCVLIRGILDLDTEICFGDPDLVAGQIKKNGAPSLVVCAGVGLCRGIRFGKNDNKKYRYTCDPPITSSKDGNTLVSIK